MTAAFATISADDSASNTAGRTSLRPTQRPAANAHRPIAVVPADQLYYWTRAWQENERAAVAEIKAGKVRSFETADAAIHWLLADD